jgi:hypothetical protein
MGDFVSVRIPITTSNNAWNGFDLTFSIAAALPVNLVLLRGEDLATRFARGRFWGK